MTGEQQTGMAIAASVPNSPKEERASIDFLDFLFTVAISVGMTPEVIGQDGLLSEGWHVMGTWPDSEAWFDISVFLLGFFNLTLSWFGYHASIERMPLNYSSTFGLFRFNIDVVLVVLYGIMLIEYQRFGVVLVCLLFVHAIFVVWDYLKVREHPNKFLGSSLWRFRREWVSLFAFAFVFTTAILHFICDTNEWIALSLAIFITVFYRVNKYFPTWERLLGYTGNSR